MGFKSFWSLWIYWINPVFVYVSFNTQIVKMVVKKQIHMYVRVINLKIKIFPDFRVFILSPIPKNENPEITGILQKGHNTEMWECSFKSSCNAVQMTSNSKSFSHIPNLVAGIWVLKTFESSGFINLISFWLCQFQHSKSWNNDRKTGPHASELYRSKNKNFLWFPGFHFETYTQKRKFGNHGNSAKQP